MADLSYQLFDTAPLGVAANTDHKLFQVLEGADATHTRDYTNSRGAGVFPQTEQFVIDHIGVTIDDAIVIADVDLITLESYLEVTVNNQTMLRSPLSAFIQHEGYFGHYTLAVAADRALIGRIGKGFRLAMPIVIKGGINWDVTIHQGVALSAVTNHKCILTGTLTRPN